MNVLPGSFMSRYLISVSLLLSSLLIAALATIGVPVAAVESGQSLDAKISSVLPSREEDRWLTIPWRTNAMQARLEAQNLNRPMFLWIMNGNPMGCT
jgi:hypothetical protein